MRKALTLMCVALTILMASVSGAAPEISVSSDGAAVVHDSRAFDIAAGRSEVVWSGLSNGLAASSLVLDTGKDTVVLSQSFESDLADPAALLQQAMVSDDGRGGGHVAGCGPFPPLRPPRPRASAPSAFSSAAAGRGGERRGDARLSHVDQRGVEVDNIRPF